MWCKFCNIETNEETCPVCGKPTSEDIPSWNRQDQENICQCMKMNVEHIYSTPKT